MAAERESERTTPATGSTDSTDPWRWKKKMSWARPASGPRIRDEPFPKGFTLPRDTPKYTGSVKPEDWLVDYSTAVNIANGNKRVAVKYVLLML